MSSWDPEEIPDFDEVSIMNASAIGGNEGMVQDEEGTIQDTSTLQFGSIQNEGEEVNAPPLPSSDEDEPFDDKLFGTPTRNAKGMPNKEVMSSQSAGEKESPQGQQKPSEEEEVQGMKYLQEMLEKAFKANKDLTREVRELKKENQEFYDRSGSYVFVNETSSAENERNKPAVQEDAPRDNQAKPSSSTDSMGLQANEMKTVMLALAHKMTTKSSSEADGDNSKDKVIKNDLKIPNFVVREVGQRALDLETWTKKVKSLLKPISDSAEEFWDSVYDRANKAYVEYCVAEPLACLLYTSDAADE